MNEYVRLIISALLTLTTTIPLVVKLVEYVKKTIKEKNWPEVVKIVMKYMERAESMFVDGASRKEWVLAMVRASAELVKYELDMDAISSLIDELCDMSKIVNAPPSVG